MGVLAWCTRASLPSPASCLSAVPPNCTALQVAACGKGSLAALADWKPPAATPLAEPKQRAHRGGRDEHSEAFTAAAVSAMFDRH